MLPVEFLVIGGAPYEEIGTHPNSQSQASSQSLAIAIANKPGRDDSDQTQVSKADRQAHYNGKRSPYYQYRESHYKDMTDVRPSYFYTGILYIIPRPGC